MMTNSSHGPLSLRISQLSPMITHLPCVIFVSSEGLIEDIETDKRVALKSLMRPAYQKFMHDKHFEPTPAQSIPTQTNNLIPVHPESL